MTEATYDRKREEQHEIESVGTGKSEERCTSRTNKRAKTAAFDFGPMRDSLDEMDISNATTGSVGNAAGKT